jgi:MoxR-like ATPase
VSQKPTELELSALSSDRKEAEFIAEKVAECSAKLKLAQEEIAKEVWGQDDVIELTVACLLADGHLLAEGVPGVAKTRLVTRVARALGLNDGRIQFTPDLMPSDILGSEVLRQDENGNSKLEFDKGPVFTQFLMADEINRASPKVQAALLQAMQERKVTVGKKTEKLQRPFLVMATQNPLEKGGGGTYELPEAQLDRFLMRIFVDYPDEEAEKKVMVQTTGTGEKMSELFAKSAKSDLTRATDKDDVSKIKKVLNKNDLILMQKLAKSLPLPQKVVDAASTIVRRARPDNENAPDLVKEYVSWGPGPRAYQAFAQVAKARALMDGRVAPSVEDVLAVVDPVLEHRMALNFQARGDNITYQDIKKTLVNGIG